MRGFSSPQFLSDPWRDERARIEWEKNAENREAASAFLDHAIEIVDHALAAMESLNAPSKELMRKLAVLANKVLGRFSLVDGFLPLELEFQTDMNERQINKIFTQDRRELCHFSTGQKGQTAISLLAGQNLAISRMLSHRVLLLDDVTTSYDLSNLTREAILWRQLAYGGKGDQRRQVFISSHHEDFTNHMLDLLVPPDGRELRLLRFEAWDPDTGPEISSFKVTATRSAEGDGDVRKAFAEDLEEIRWSVN